MLLQRAYVWVVTGLFVGAVCIQTFGGSIFAGKVLSAEQSSGDYKTFYEEHRWFALRDAVRSAEAKTFYRGAVESAFNHVEKAEKDLRSAIRANPHSHEAYEARTLLTGMYLRNGRYRELFVETEAMFKEKPEDEDTKSVYGLFRALSETPDQTAAQDKPSRIQMHLEDGNMFLPITINSRPSEYVIDTGANMSIISESEATRLGLVVLSTDTKVGGMTGAGTSARVTVADGVVIGNLRLSHVAFLVVGDKQPPFDELAPVRRGILGISVILAMGKLRWNPHDGTFECGLVGEGADLNKANMAFEGATPLTQVSFQGKALDFSLDSGAQDTELYPKFAKMFAELVNSTGKKESRQLTGVDGSATYDSVMLPSLILQAGGRDLLLKPAHVLLVEHTQSSGQYFGNLGMDLLTQARSMTLDFRAMRIELE